MKGNHKSELPMKRDKLPDEHALNNNFRFKHTLGRNTNAFQRRIPELSLGQTCFCKNFLFMAFIKFSELDIKLELTFYPSRD